MRRMLSLIVRAAAVVGSLAAGAATASTSPSQPKLIVAISVDQFSAGLFNQHRGRFRHGLRRLASEGVVFSAGYQSHAATETCPGHSTLLTGRHPSGTGIIANNWYDPAAPKEDMYCVRDPAHPVPNRPDDPRGPANLDATTLGEWLKTADPRARNVAVSGKDRAAITMSGHDPDGVFWWDQENGFTTSVPASTDAAVRLAPVARFNAKIAAAWTRRPPRWQVLDKACGSLSERRRYDAVTLDHRLPPAGAPARGQAYRADAAFNRWFRASPMMDRLTIDLASELIGTYRLGRGPATDVLSVSLSATDYVGHTYGSQGPEMCDQIAHLDRALGEFLTRLERLGVPVVVVLSADHGGPDAAERLTDRAIPAVRLDLEAMMKELGEGVRAKLGLAADPITGDGQQIYIRAEAAADPAQRRRIVEEALRLLRARPEVVAAYTREELLAVRVRSGVPVDELTLPERFAESTHPTRSGDISVAMAPYAGLGRAVPGRYINGHGSPWNYDRRVPMVFWWPGAEGYEQSNPVETVDIAPTLANLARVPSPPVDGRCLDLDRTAADTCAPSKPPLP